jgi:hypothetical protein
MTEIQLVTGGVIQEIALQDRLHAAYFMQQIVEEGLRDCHMTVTGGDLSFEQLIDAISDFIDVRDAQKTNITEL